MNTKIIKKSAVSLGIIWLLTSGKISLAEDTTQQISESSNPKAVIKIQKGNLSSEIPFSLNLDGSDSSDPENGKLTYEWKFPDNEIITSKNPRSYRFKEAGNFEISLTVTNPEGLSNTASLQIEAKEKTKKTKASKPKKTKFQNGDLSTTIIITEVFPNPKGKDEDKEWLELYNPTNQDLNLGNWQIAQSELNSETAKPKLATLSDQLTIEAKSYLILDNSHLKSLTNQQNKVELLDYNGKVIDSIQYKKTEENLSLSKIHLKNAEKPNSSKQILKWTEATKNSPNPVFYQLKGAIRELSTESFLMQIQNKEIWISYSPDQLNQTLLQAETELIALVEKSDNKFKLKNYKILKTATSNKQSANKTDNQLIFAFKISFLIFLILVIVLLIKRKFPNQNRPPRGGKSNKYWLK